MLSLLSLFLTIAISITHIYLYFNPVKKTLYHAVGIIFSEAELFVIRCGIN